MNVWLDDRFGFGKVTTELFMLEWQLNQQYNIGASHR